VPVRVLKGPRRTHLQRLFSTFPSGWPGVGLLLLRAAAGIVLITETSSFLFGTGTLTSSNWAVALIALVSGVSLLLGFLMPVGGILATICSAVVALSLVPIDSLNLPQIRAVATLLAVMAAALSLLGPGAFSMDSRLFGRREIIIRKVSQSRRME